MALKRNWPLECDGRSPEMKVLLTILLFFFSYTCFAQAFGFVQYGSSAPPPKDSIRVNLDTTQNQAGWLNLKGSPGLNVLSGTGGNNHTITVTSVSTSNWLPYSSNETAFPNNGTVNGTVWNWATSVMQEEWFSYSSSSQDTFKLASPKFIVSGLLPSALYTITLTGSQQYNFADSSEFRVGTSAGIQAAGIHPVTGGQSVEAFPEKNNTAQYAQFTNVSPDASGNIQIWVNEAKTQVLGGISGFIIKQQ